MGVREEFNFAETSRTGISLFSSLLTYRTAASISIDRVISENQRFHKNQRQKPNKNIIKNLGVQKRPQLSTFFDIQTFKQQQIHT